MRSYRALCCALSLAIAAAAPAAAAQKKPAAKKAPPGRTETLACRLGTEDRHARIAVVVIRGKTDSFAYYSKWKPRTCSIYLQRNRDPYSKWADNGAVTTVSLEKGAFLIEHKAGEYHFTFRDIDRERYCGMGGVINGSLTIKRGTEQCVLDGDIMVEGTPLGEVEAHMKEPEGPLAPEAASTGAAAAGAPAVPAAKPPAATAPAVTTAPAVSPAVSAPTVLAPVTPPAATPPAATPPAATPPAATPPAETQPAATPQAKPDLAPVGAPAAASGEKQAPAAQQPVAADSAGPSPATCCAPTVKEKPAEAPSTTPFSAFFRSLKPRPPDEQTP